MDGGTGRSDNETSNETIKDSPPPPSQPSSPPPPPPAESHISKGEDLGDDFDAVMTRLGTGWWHVVCYLAVGYWNTVLPYHTVAGAFLSPPVNHTCLAPPNAVAPTAILPVNFTTTSRHHNSTITYSTDYSTEEFDSTCTYLTEDEVSGGLVEAPCTEWIFDNSTFSSTVTSEFSLVCNYKFLRAAHQSIYMAGMLLGAGFNGFLADKFGRWTMIAISTSSYTVIALGSAWLTSMPLILIARFVLGSMHPTSLMTTYILVMEITEKKRRSVMAMITLSFWSIGTTFWGLWAYLERDWRLLQTYVSLFCPVFLPALFFLKESPRWLVVTGRHEKALKVLQTIARMNGTTLPPADELLSLMRKVQEQSTCSMEEAKAQAGVPLRRRILRQMTILFSTRKLFTITVVMCISYFVVAMIFFGLTLGASALGVDPFLYMSISGLVELPAIVIIFVVKFFGRKKSGILVFGVCAAALIFQTFVSESHQWASIILINTGKICSSAAFQVLFLYSSELYPTEIRTQGMSAGMMASRVGGFVAPFIMGALEPRYPWGIYLVFGCASAVASVSFIPLWETNHTCLPDTVAQLEGMRVGPKETKEEAKEGQKKGHKPDEVTKYDGRDAKMDTRC